MKCNQWTLGLATIGVVSLASVARAEEMKMAMVQTAVASTTLSGFVDTSMQWNLGSGNANAPTYGFGGAKKADGFNLNVVDLNLEKDADPADGWGAGYRIELWMGPDAVTYATQSTGVGTDFAIKNAYVDLKAPIGTGLDVKIGVWDTITGYEVADSIYNPNFTRSYSWTIEQTTDTGVLLGYTINEMLNVQAGVADTYGPTINARAINTGGSVNESYKAYMAAATLTASTNWGWVGGSTLTATIINGFNAGSVGSGVAGNAGVGANETSYYVGATMNTPLKELKVGSCVDFIHVGQQPATQVGFGGPRNSFYQENFAVYATYQFNDKLSFNGRAEYFEQSKKAAALGLPAKVFETTFTVQYDLWKNVMSRVEARWDHQAGSGPTGPFPAYGGTGVGGAGTLYNSYVLLANIAYKF